MGTARRGAADRLLLVGRFSALAYLHVLVWLSLWVLVPMIALGWRPMALDSGSMGPVIQAGDVVLVAPYDGDELGAGAIITFLDPAEPGRLVTHRVTGTDGDGNYLTKGDANADADSTPLPPENIQGVGRLVVPRVGLPVVWLQQGRQVHLVLAMLSVVLAMVLSGPGPKSREAEQAPAVAPRRRRTLRRPRPHPVLSAHSEQLSRNPGLSAHSEQLDRDTGLSAHSEQLDRNPGLSAHSEQLDRDTGLSAHSERFGSRGPVPAPPAGPARRQAQPTWPLPAPPAAAPAFPTVPAVRYRLRLPRPPAPLTLPTPPQWAVSMVPPPPGTAPVAPIPAPPRPAAVRRGALSGREAPGWAPRLHAVVLVLAMVAGLGAVGAANASPAAAAFSSTRWSTVANAGNSFTADRLDAPEDLVVNAALANCTIGMWWDHSTSAWREGYHIYRSAAGGEFVLAGTNIPGDSTWEDPGPIHAGVEYRYKVVSYYDSWLSGPTNEGSVQGPLVCPSP